MILPCPGLAPSFIRSACIWRGQGNCSRASSLVALLSESKAKPIACTDPLVLSPAFVLHDKVGNNESCAGKRTFPVVSEDTLRNVSLPQRYLQLIKSDANPRVSYRPAYVYRVYTVEGAGFIYFRLLSKFTALIWHVFRIF